MITAIIQARLASERLPHKVLMEVVPGISMLEMVIRKVRLATKVDNIWITSPDWAVVKLAKHLGCNANWWNKKRDVLREFYVTGQNSVVEYCGECVDFVRITADCPLIKPEIIDKCIEEFLDRNVDLVYNSFENTGADGSDVEVFSNEALEKAHRSSTEREHPTVWMRENLRTHYVETPFEGCSVDTLEDLERVRKILRGRTE